MVKNLSRPEMKIANVKVTDAEMAYFELGIGQPEFVLPSERDDYRSDARAVELVRAVKAGEDLSGCNFKGINLKKADLSGARLAGANLSEAILYQTSFKGADLKGTHFTGAYLEGVDFEDADLTGAHFEGVFARALTLNRAQIDEEALKKLTALELLIQKIESGEIDIRFLSRADLLCLDLRRLDLTHVDLEGLDLSGFILEGVNLRGTYIDPKQLMSLEGLQHYYMSVRALTAKRLMEEEAKTLGARGEELTRYAQMQMQERNQNKIIYSNAAELRRPDKRIPLKAEMEITPVKTPVPLEQALRMQAENDIRDFEQADQRERADLASTAPEELAALEWNETQRKRRDEAAQKIARDILAGKPTRTIEEELNGTSIVSSAEQKRSEQTQEIEKTNPHQTSDTLAHLVTPDDKTRIKSKKTTSTGEEEADEKKITWRDMPTNTARPLAPHPNTQQSQKKKDAKGQESALKRSSGAKMSFDTNEGSANVSGHASALKPETYETPVASTPASDTEKSTRVSLNQKAASGLNAMAPTPRKITSQAFETAESEQQPMAEPSRLIDRQEPEFQKTKTKNRT